METKADNLSVLSAARDVAHEKGIDFEEVLGSLEFAIQKAAKTKYGSGMDIRAKIDRKTGDIHLARYTEVVASKEDIENEDAQIAFADVLKNGGAQKVGDFIVEDLPMVNFARDFGRISATFVKQQTQQKVREAERNRQFNEFADRVGTIGHGVVKRVESRNVIVDLGRAEASLPREEMIPREILKTGDRVRAYITDVRPAQKGPQIFMSRTCPQFLVELFKQEISEVYNGIVEIKGVARDPGSRAKMAVVSNDNSIDPVGTCIGRMGTHVQAIVTELQGEKIDIIKWSEDEADFVVKALAPAEVVKVVFDEDEHEVEVVVPDDNLSRAIGARGQNVRLAAALTGWNIDIMTEDQEAERREKEVKEFIDVLNVDEVLARLLLQENFKNVDEIAMVDLSEIAAIDGFDEELAEELQKRAKAYVAKRDSELAVRLKELKVSDALRAVDGLTPAMLVKLGENDVKSLEDFAYLAGDELLEIIGADAMSLQAANDLIMKIREPLLEKENA